MRSSDSFVIESRVTTSSTERQEESHTPHHPLHQDNRRITTTSPFLLWLGMSNLIPAIDCPSHHEIRGKML